MRARVPLLLAALATAMAQSSAGKVRSDDAIEPSTNITFIRGKNVGCGHTNGHLYTEIDVEAIIRDYNDVDLALQEAQQVLLVKINNSAVSIDASMLNQTFFAITQELRSSGEDLLYICQILDCNEKLHTNSLSPPPTFDSFTPMPPWQTFRSLLTSNTEEQARRAWDSRDKRQILEMFLSTIGLGVSIYDLEQIQELKGQLFDQRNAQKLLASDLQKTASQTSRNSLQIQAIREKIKGILEWSTVQSYGLKCEEIIGYISSFSKNIQRFSEGLMSILIRKEITFRFFDTSALKLGIQTIGARADKKGLRLVYSSVEEAAKAPVSYLTDGGKTYLMIHLPLVPKETFTLYEHLPVPMALPDGRAVYLTDPNRFIAVNPDETEYLLLSTEMLNECEEGRDTFICPWALTRKGLHSSCLGALYVGEIESASRLCKVSLIQSDNEIITQVSGSRVHYYVPQTSGVPADIKCSPGSGPKNKPILLKGIGELSISRGCRLTTPNYVYRSVKDADIEVTIVTKPLLHFNLKLLDNYLNTHDTELTNDLPPYTIVSLPDPKRDLADTPSSSNHTIGLVLLATVAVTLVLSAAYCTTVLARERMRQQRQRRDLRGRGGGGGIHQRTLPGAAGPSAAAAPAGIVRRVQSHRDPATDPVMVPVEVPTESPDLLATPDPVRRLDEEPPSAANRRRWAFPSFRFGRRALPSPLPSPRELAIAPDPPEAGLQGPGAARGHRELPGGEGELPLPSPLSGPAAATPPLDGTLAEQRGGHPPDAAGASPSTSDTGGPPDR